MVYECVQPQTPVYWENGVALTEVAPGCIKGRCQANKGHQKSVALYPLLLIILVYACKRALEANNYSGDRDS